MQFYAMDYGGLSSIDVSPFNKYNKCYCIVFIFWMYRSCRRNIILQIFQRTISLNKSLY